MSSADPRSSEPMTAQAIDILATLVGFDTTSRGSNLALIEWVEAYLSGLGVASKRVPNADGTKANLLATIGPDVVGGVVLCLAHPVGVAQQRPGHRDQLHRTVGQDLFGGLRHVDPVGGDHGNAHVLGHRVADVRERAVGNRRDDGRHPHPGREVGQFVQTELVVRPAAQRQCHIGAVAKGLAQPPQAQAASVVGVVRQENGK